MKFPTSNEFSVIASRVGERRFYIAADPGGLRYLAAVLLALAESRESDGRVSIDFWEQIPLEPGSFPFSIGRSDSLLDEWPQSMGVDWHA